MLREPRAGCQEPRPGGGPMGGRRVPPQEEAPVKGEGGLGWPALRAKATDLGGQWLDW